MPILSFGSFTAKPSGHSGSIVESGVVQFRYYPIGDVLFAILVVFFLWKIRRGKRAFTTVWHWVLVPGLVGVACLVSSHQVLIFVSIPLLLVTASLLTWYRLRIRSWFGSAVWTIIVCAALVTFVGFLMDTPTVALVFQSFIAAIYISFPLIVIRISVRKSVSSRRLLIASVVAILLPLTPLLILCFVEPISRDQFQMVISAHAGFMAASAVPFAVLVRWNSW
ncbi:MAG: hypothetical protein ABIH23_13750, partial [bacterium]